MPKNITRVTWSATELPYGLSFSETTGTFSGTPEDEGEYYIPVRVRTNYGTDEKEVKIVVTGKSAPVYAIGSYAATWSRGATPDEDGFYPIDIPSAYKLTPRNNGFSAHILGKGLYYCGVYWIYTIAYIPEYNAFEYHNTPVPGDTREAFCGTVSSANISISGTTIPSGKTKSLAYVLTITSNGEVEFRTSGCSINDNGNITYLNGSARITNADVVSYTSGGFKLPEAAYQVSRSLNTGVSWLADKGASVMTIKFTDSGTAHTATVSKQLLGYNAIKMFAPTGFSTLPFKYLSDNKYLDNNPENFTLGVIKDAWVFDKLAYVQTENNNLYEYNSGNWDYLGYYDIKKLEIPASDVVLMLTTDGKLYYKGRALAEINITEAQENFTQIFPNKKILDMTLGISYQRITNLSSNKVTLAVLVDPD